MVTLGHISMHSNIPVPGIIPSTDAGALKIKQIYLLYYIIIYLKLSYLCDLNIIKNIENPIPIYKP